MSWRQYDSLYDDLKNVFFKASLAPFIRKLNSSKTLNKSGFLPKRVIICGCPRSGTTLMNELLRCYDDIYVMNREEYALRFPYIALKNKYIATKHPIDFRHLDKIIDTFKCPLIIHMMRDPRDVIVSEHFKNKGNYLINYPTWTDAMNSYENFDYDNKMLISYDDLIKNPVIIQNRLATMLDLEIKSDFNNFHNNVTRVHEDIKSLGGIRPIDPNNSGKYKQPKHFLRIKEQLQKHPEISKQLIKYGYEKDRAWEDYFLSEGTK